MVPELPTTIWFLICEHLSSHIPRRSVPAFHSQDPMRHYGNRQALKNLCLVSRDVGAVAERYLFEWFEWGEGKNTARKLLNFLRTILANSSLASHVKQISLESWIKTFSPKDKVASELVEIYSQIATHLGFSVDDYPFSIENVTGEADDEADSLPAIVQLLIPLLPNLESCLVMLTIGDRPFNVLSRLHEAGVIQPFGLITKLSLDYSDTERGYDLSRYALLLKLTPNVRILHMHQCAGIRVDNELALQDYLPRYIEHLSISYSSLEERALRHLINHCPRLTTFGYSSGGVMVSEDCDNEIVPVQAVAALHAARDTLAHVALEFSGHINFESFEEDLSVAHFADFPVLETAIVDFRVIIPANSNRED